MNRYVTRPAVDDLRTDEEVALDKRKAERYLMKILKCSKDELGPINNQDYDLIDAENLIFLMKKETEYLSVICLNYAFVKFALYEMDREIKKRYDSFYAQYNKKRKRTNADYEQLDVRYCKIFDDIDFDKLKIQANYFKYLECYEDLLSIFKMRTGIDLITEGQREIYEILKVKKLSEWRVYLAILEVCLNNIKMADYFYNSGLYFYEYNTLERLIQGRIYRREIKKESILRFVKIEPLENKMIESYYMYCEENETLSYKKYTEKYFDNCEYLPDDYHEVVDYTALIKHYKNIYKYQETNYGVVLLQDEEVRKWNFYFATQTDNQKQILESRPI